MAPAGHDLNSDVNQRTERAIASLASRLCLRGAMWGNLRLGVGNISLPMAVATEKDDSASGISCRR